MKSSLPARNDIALLEGIERDAFAGLFAAAPDTTAAALGIAYARRGDVGLFATRNIAAPPINRALGMGIGEPATETEIASVLIWMREHCAPGWCIQSVPGALPEALPQWLSGDGLTADNPGWAKLWRRAPGPAGAPISTSMEIREVDTGGAELFGTIVARGFGLPMACAPWFARIVGQAGFTAYLAYDNAQPVASGATFLSGGWCWIGFDATLPEFRRRGAQSALLARRFADGWAKGVSGFVAETGAPAEGEEHHHPSYRNLLRAGFEVAYLRPNYRHQGLLDPLRPN